jgi:hypothetical protein
VGQRVLHSELRAPPLRSLDLAYLAVEVRAASDRAEVAADRAQVRAARPREAGPGQVAPALVQAVRRPEAAPARVARALLRAVQDPAVAPGRAEEIHPRLGVRLEPGLTAASPVMAAGMAMEFRAKVSAQYRVGPVTEGTKPKGRPTDRTEEASGRPHGLPLVRKTGICRSSYFGSHFE